MRGMACAIVVTYCFLMLREFYKNWKLSNKK